MKNKILFMFAVILLSVTNVSALSITSDGNYLSNRGINYTKEEYNILSQKFLDSDLNSWSERGKKYYLENIDSIEIKKVYSITTDIIDNKGNIIESYTKENATEEEAKSVMHDEKLMVMPDNQLHKVNKYSVLSPMGIGKNYTYSTSSKEVSIIYSAIIYGEAHAVSLSARWFKLPKIRQFDVLAFRWDTSRPLSNVYECHGTQDGGDKYTSYELDDKNMKRTKNGIGESMNLYDNASKLELSMYCEFDKDLGENVYGTYQHAKNGNANTLNISKSYSFSSNGLGGVLYYSNSNYRSYYDGMQGVLDTLYGGPSFSD